MGEGCHPRAALNLEHQLILEKAVREEHDQRVHQMDALNKGLDRVNHEVTQALRDEMLTREARRTSCAANPQSVLKLPPRTRTRWIS